MIYPDLLESHKLVESDKVKQKISTLKASSKDGKTVYYAVKIIQNEIKGMTDKMNWLPSYADLPAEKMDIGIHLSTFLNVILSGQLVEIVMGNGRISVFYFHITINMLSNKTELINMANCLGHGICYSLLEEMETENA